MKKTIPFTNLVDNLTDEVDEAIRKVLKKGRFILGEQVALFEKEFSSYLGVPFGVGVASGTDALILALRAIGITKGDEVIVPANSYPTAFAVAAAHGRARLVDINPDTFNIDEAQIEKVITRATKAIVVVHLYGQSADLEPILKIAKKHKLSVIEDCAQAHGALYKGKKVGTFGDIGCFSFYPTKNLGGIGDGGMVVTNKVKIAETVLSLRMYGEKARYKSNLLSTHSRLDEVQAAVLRVKLKKLDVQNKLRQDIAKAYEKHLIGTAVILPRLHPLAKHVYHLFVIRTKKRNKLQNFLHKNHVETAVHFPLPIHLVKPFLHLGYKKGDFPIAEKAALEILSLPCYPELKRTHVKHIATLVKRFLN